MLQRTRAMQRNVRMVLILVDSQSSVADLCLKTGNPLLTENALLELEKGGFIEPRKAGSSLWAEGARGDQAVRSAAAVRRNDSLARPVSDPSAPAALSESPSAISVGGVASAAASGGDSATSSTLDQSRDSASPIATESQTGCMADEPLVSPKAADASLVVRQTRAKAKHCPTLITLMVVGVLGALWVIVFPASSNLSEFEATIATACGRSAKVGALRLAVYPQPSIVLGDVRIGAGKDAIHIDEIRLLPAIETLLAAKTIYRKVTISGVSLPIEVVTGLSSVFKALSSPAVRFSINRFGFEKTTITFSALSLSNMGGEAILSDEGGLQSLNFNSSDRSMRVVLAPHARGLDVVLDAAGWRPVLGSAFLFDSVSLSALVDDRELTIKDMALRIFDGVVEGNAVLRANHTLNIAGDLSFKRISAARLGDAIGFGQQFSGDTSGKLRFLAQGNGWEALFSSISAAGDFVMQRGSVRGIDLAEAARSASKTPVQGGATSFENLSGTVKLTPAGSLLSGLVVTSGLMQSTGTLSVSRELMVSGTMELRIRGTANQTRIPIAVSGPLKSPTVTAGRSAGP